MKNMPRFIPCSRLALIAPLLIAMSHNAFGAQELIACPPELSAESVKLIQAPDSWTPFTPAPFVLSSAGFTGGPPAMLADLKPDSVQGGKQQLLETWKFGKGGAGGSLWVVCGYGGAGGALTLSKEISNTFSECSVRYTKGIKAGAKNLLISCQ